MRKRRLLLAVVLALLLAGCQKKDTEPTNVDTGMTAIENQEYADALTSFEAAISAEEDLIQAYRGEGMAYMGLGEYEDAVNSFDKALGETDEKMMENRKDIFYYKAAALYRQEDYAGTAGVCDEILKITSEADALYLRGACALALGDEKKAEVNFAAAIKDAPKDYDLYLNIYECYNEKKLSAKGDEYLQKALDIESDKETDAYNKARIYYFLENYEEAQAQLLELVAEKNQDALLLMGQVYLALQDSAHSRNMYEQYLAEYGETPEVYNGMALADMAEENYDAALANIAKGLALEEENGKQELSYNEIVAYEYKRDFDTAKVKALEYTIKYPADEMGLKEYDFLQSR